MRKITGAMLMVGLCGCPNGGIPTGTGPLRIPTLTVSAGVPAVYPTCDGSFVGQGSIAAAYPAAAGNPAFTRSTIHKESTTVSMSLRPDRAEFNGPASSPKDFSIEDGELLDVCAAGTFVIRVESVDNRTPPAATQIDRSAPVNVPAVEFKMPQGLTTTMQTFLDSAKLAHEKQLDRTAPTAEPNQEAA
jgi:hypothetical protein